MHISITGRLEHRPFWTIPRGVVGPSPGSSHHAAVGRLLTGEVSYATCGYRSPLNGQFLAAALREGRTLRVGMPSDSGSGYTLVTEEGGERGGSYVTFMQRVFHAHDMQYRLVPTSQGSIAMAKGSSWAACIEDVAIGALDLCVGNFGQSEGACSNRRRNRSLFLRGHRHWHTHTDTLTHTHAHTHTRTHTHTHAHTHTQTGSPTHYIGRISREI